MNNNVTTIYTSTKTSAAYLSKDTSNSFVNNMFENENRTNTIEGNGILRSHVTIDDCNGYHHSKQLIEEYSESKSFIQQRVERLYGPGALAQGFFVTKRRQNRSYNGCDNTNSLDISNNDSHSKSFNITTVQKSNGDSDTSRLMKQSTSSPALPVMRHLRPEFRAQLPALSPRKTVPINTVVVLDSIKNELAQIQKSITVPVLKDSLVENVTNAGVNGHDRHVDDNSAIANKLNGVNKSNGTDGVNNSTIDSIDAGPANADTSNNSTVAAAVKDGHYFLQVLQREADRLLALAEQAEDLLDSESELSEDTTGLIRSTSGKARLLVSQKMKQFKGLCSNNITQNVREAFPTTNEDLQGFWDMVMLQVNQVDCLFQDLDKLKSNNWEEEKVVVTKPTASTGVRRLVNRKTCNDAMKNPGAEEARKHRELQRKRMIEERRKAMREQKQQSSCQESVEIFVPENI